MARLIPTVDIVFKKVFGSCGNEHILISFLNSILSEEDQIKSLTLVNPYNLKQARNSKLSILDIKAVGHDGKQFNVEVQVSRDYEYKQRALYYWSKLYTEQLKNGDTYNKLRKTIGIHVTNFDLIPQSKKYHTRFGMMELDELFRDYHYIEMHVIDLTKFLPKQSSTFDGLLKKLHNKLDAWTSFLACNDLLTHNNLHCASKDFPHEIDEALTVIESMSINKKELQAYEDRLREQMTYETRMACAVQEALEQGMEQGRKRAKIELAQKLLAKSFSIEDVAEATELTIEEVRSLQ